MTLLSARIDVLGTGSDGTDPSFVLSIRKHGVYSDDQSVVRGYLFNASEGTQRLCLENQIRVKTINQIFLTKLSSETVTGIPGLIMGLSDQGAADLRITGPVGTMNFVQATRALAKRKFPALQVEEIISRNDSESATHDNDDDGIVFSSLKEYKLASDEDKYLEVIPIIISGQKPLEQQQRSACQLCKHAVVTTTSSSTSITKLTKNPTSVVESRQQELKSFYQNSTSSEEDEDEEDSSVSNRKWLGKFYADNAPEKLIHMDSILARHSGNFSRLQEMLKNKYSKKRKRSEDDNDTPTIPPPKDVPETFLNSIVNGTATSEKEPTSDTVIYIMRVLQEKIVWVISCSSLDSILRIVNHPDLTHLCDLHTPDMIVHFSSISVVKDVRYTKWMKSFPERTQHVVFDGAALVANNNTATATSVYRGICYTQSMNQLRKLNSHSPDLFHRPPVIGPNVVTTSVAGITISGFENTRIATPKLSNLLVCRKTQNAGYIALPPLKENIQNQVEESSSPYLPKMLFLGTGSAAPSLLRASSSIYIQFDSSFAGMLLDVGEGTTGQLWRHFGDKVNNVIASLRCIWVSHKHADHCAGLLKLLTTYQKSSKSSTKLLVLLPESVRQYIVSSGIIEEGHGVELVSIRKFSFWNSKNLIHQSIGRYVHSLNSIPVIHCYDSYGIVLTLWNGMKIVYSGDTRPCNNLIQAGYGADLLVHEATFGDDMYDDAVKKKHSTVGEALDVATRMRSAHVILTHFSQRYPVLPPIATGEVIMAFDSMSVSLDPQTLRDLPYRMAELQSALL